MKKISIIIVLIVIALMVVLPAAQSAIKAQVDSQINQTQVQIQTSVSNTVSDALKNLAPLGIVVILFIILAALGGRGGSGAPSSPGPLSGLGSWVLLIIVGIFAMAILPYVQPWMEAQSQKAALENKAAEKAIEESASATKTAVAVDARIKEMNAALAITQSLVSISITVQAGAYSVRATSTAEPFNAGIAESNANNTKIRDSLLTFALGSIILIGLLCGLGIYFILKRKSIAIPRDRNGLAPILYDRGVGVDLDTIPSGGFTIERPGVTEQMQQMLAILSGQEVQALPAPKLNMRDEGMTFEQRVQILLARLRAQSMAALMRPGATLQNKMARLDVVEQSQQKRIEPPHTEITALGGDAIALMEKMIARKNGGELTDGKSTTGEFRVLSSDDSQGDPNVVRDEKFTNEYPSEPGQEK